MAVRRFQVVENSLAHGKFVKCAEIMVIILFTRFCHNNHRQVSTYLNK